MVYTSAFFSVSGMVFGGFKVEKYAFIYNYGYRDKGRPWFIGALVDNRTQKAVRLIEEYDRKTVGKAREVFTTFFHASTRIDTVYLVEKVPPTTYNDLGWRLMETPCDWMQL